MWRLPNLLLMWGLPTLTVYVMAVNFISYFRACGVPLLPSAPLFIPCFEKWMKCLWSASLILFPRILILIYSQNVSEVFFQRFPSNECVLIFWLTYISDIGVQIKYSYMQYIPLSVDIQIQISINTYPSIYICLAIYIYSYTHEYETNRSLPHILVVSLNFLHSLVCLGVSYCFIYICIFFLIWFPHFTFIYLLANFLFFHFNSPTLYLWFSVW